jgi:hypothetical protein
MIAIVFYGTINNAPVVVKMLKKGVESRIVDGCVHLRFLRGIVRCSSVFSENTARIFDMLDIVVQSADYLQMQCDLTHEQRAMVNVNAAWTKFQQQYDRTSSVCNQLNRIEVPHIWNVQDEPSASSFVIMDKVNGVPAFGLRDSGVKRRGIALLQCFILSQALLLDYYHTDLHSGNVLFDYNHDSDTLTLGVYDYGMHVKIGQKEREFLASLLEIIMNHQVVRTASFDALQFCRLLFEVPENVVLVDTQQLSELIESMGKDTLTGALSAEILHAFIKECAHIIGIKPKLHRCPVQLVLGTSMVNSLTYELSDNNMQLLTEIGITVYEDIVLS